MKNIFPTFIGNERLKQTLSGNLSHAYIIEGSPGSGRLTAARCAAAAALCENASGEASALPCGECSVCSRIFRGIHPDVSEYSTGSKKSIGIDTARELRSQVFLSPTESEFKFFIIRDADLMTPEAQNALLISLEEPPVFSIFFLLVTDKSLLLETIRSRCIILNTEKLDDGVIADALRKTPEGERLYSSDPAAFDSTVKDAGGSLGNALSRIKGEASDSGEAKIAEKLVRVILTGSPAEKVHLSAEFPKTRDAQSKVLTFAVSAVRDVIACKLRTDAPLLFYSSPSDTKPFMTIPIIRLMKLHSSFEDGREALYGNSSTALTAERIIMQKL